MLEIRHRFSERRPEGYGIDFSDEESLTKQEFAGEVNINNIIAKHRQTGVVTHIERRIPQYGDYSFANSLHDALDLVMEADEEFMRLPASVREKAHNDPARFFEMLATESGEKELTEAGLHANIPREGDGNDSAPISDEGNSDVVADGTEQGNPNGDAGS